MMLARIWASQVVASLLGELERPEVCQTVVQSQAGISSEQFNIEDSG